MEYLLKVIQQNEEDTNNFIRIEVKLDELFENYHYKTWGVEEQRKIVYKEYLFKENSAELVN